MTVNLPCHCCTSNVYGIPSSVGGLSVLSVSLSSSSFSCSRFFKVSEVVSRVARAHVRVWVCGCVGCGGRGDSRCRLLDGIMIEELGEILRESN